MEVQQGRGFQYDCRTDQTGRPHEQGAQSCDETIRCPEIRGSLPGSIQDQELMLDENGLGDHGTEAARAKKPGDRNDDMKEKHDEMAHHSIVARTANAGNYGAIYQFAIDRLIRLVGIDILSTLCYTQNVTPKRGQKLIPDSERKSHLVAVRLTEEEFQALDKISAREKLPISRYVREGVAYIIKHYSK